MSIMQTSSTRRAALHVRISTTNRASSNQAVFEQNPEVQELPLRQLAEQLGNTKYVGAVANEAWGDIVPWAY
jgi:hypothetical protein